MYFDSGYYYILRILKCGNGSFAFVDAMLFGDNFENDIMFGNTESFVCAQQIHSPKTDMNVFTLVGCLCLHRKPFKKLNP